MVGDFHTYDNYSNKIGNSASLQTTPMTLSTKFLDKTIINDTLLLNIAGSNL